MSEPRRPVERSDLPPREGVWFAKPRPVRRTLRKIPDWWLPLAVGPQLYGVFAKASNVTPPLWLIYLQGVGWALLILQALVWRVIELLAMRASRRDREFSDAPAGIVEYPLEVVIVVESRELGMDRGFAWFDEGRLCFNGAACSFALASEDLLPWGNVQGKRPYKGLPGDALCLRTAGRPAYLRMLPLSSVGRFRFPYTLGRFLVRGERSVEDRQWPPLVPFGSASSPLVHLPTTPEAIGEAAARTGSARGVVRS